jgi:L-rhamnose mutarotase
MQKIAFAMHLKPGTEAEYLRRHDEIWPELSALLKDVGIADYSIFLDPHSLTLFGVLRQADGHGMDRLPDHPIMRRWWAFMADLMVVNPDNSPVVRPLACVFHLD